MRAAVLCPALCISEVMNKASMHENSISYVMRKSVKYVMRKSVRYVMRKSVKCLMRKSIKYVTELNLFCSLYN